MSIWSIGNSVLIQIHLASKLDSQLRHYPIDIERRRVRWNAFHTNHSKVQCNPIYIQILRLWRKYQARTRPFSISRARLTNSAQTTVLRKLLNQYYASQIKKICIIPCPCYALPLRPSSIRITIIKEEEDILPYIALISAHESKWGRGLSLGSLSLIAFHHFLKPNFLNQSDLKTLPPQKN
jgi:hypothetical protein